MVSFYEIEAIIDPALFYCYLFLGVFVLWRYNITLCNVTLPFLYNGIVQNLAIRNVTRKNMTQFTNICILLISI